MNKKFRIYAKRIFLTYPQLNSTKDAIKEQLFQALTSYLPFKYCISQEQHKDGNMHFHVFLEATNKFNLKNANTILTLSDNDNIKKSGDYKSVKGPTSFVLRYLTKEDKDPLTNMYFDFDTGIELSIEEKTIDVYRSAGYDAALNYFKSNASNKDLIKSYNKLRATLNNLRNDDKKNHQLSFLPLNLKEFKKHLAGQQIEDWYNHTPYKTLYLYGASGLGKTEGLKTYLSSKLGSPLDQLALVRDLEQFKEHDLDKIKSFILDDLPLQDIFKKKGEKLIHLLDRRNPTSIRILFQSITINSNTTMAITSNIPFDTLLKLLKISPKHIDPICRRTAAVEVTDKLPIIIPTKENLQQLKDNLDIYHPN